MRHRKEEKKSGKSKSKHRMEPMKTPPVPFVPLPGEEEPKAKPKPVEFAPEPEPETEEDSFYTEVRRAPKVKAKAVERNHGEPRNHPVQVNLTTEEKRVIAEQAVEMGIGIATWIRIEAVKAARSK